ncbi:hypothetical protein SETIT_2G238200v2 [Setaria italica]|uniref:Uncharacterized protein n=1 Tax=Setaria italica TaxID=4555 RepID=A0A368Q1Z2_SETIT|nr:hypothetical protein SETIT_2G238200v2 [Setaria italica]
MRAALLSTAARALVPGGLAALRRSVRPGPRRPPARRRAVVNRLLHHGYNVCLALETQGLPICVSVIWSTTFVGCTTPLDSCKVGRAANDGS